MIKRNKDDITIKQYMNVCMLIRQNCVQSDFRLSVSWHHAVKRTVCEFILPERIFRLQLKRLYPVNVLGSFCTSFCGIKRRKAKVDGNT